MIHSAGASEPRPPVSDNADRARLAGILLGAGAFLCCHLLGQSLAWSGTVGTTVLCAVWWMTECVSIPATSMLPFFLLPLCGALSDKAVAGAYGHPMILLLLGGFFLSLGLERSGVHKRLAVMLLRRIGQSPRALMLGVILTSAGFSMWISNTATTLAMLPIVLALIADSEDQVWRSRMLLGVAYGASIGGMGTPIGTPPNAILMSVASESSQVGDLSFIGWMALAMPVVLLFLPLLWLWLSRGKRDSVSMQLPQLLAWTSRERRSLCIFAAAAVLWMTRPLWTELAPMVGDSSIAMGAAALLFVIPSRSEQGALLQWSDSRDIPWGLLLLFGSGIAIAKAFQSTGISEALGMWLIDDVGIATWPRWAMTSVICTVVTFLTELTSNTATTSLLMPILVSTGDALDPLLLMVPAALSASCAFMLPVATAPNAIIFGSGLVPIRTMIREGLFLNCIGIVVITVVMTLWY